MMRRYEDDRTFFDRIIFSNEASFQLDGEMNRHNCRYWNDEKRDTHTQNPQKVNVWVGFCARGTVGLFCINANLNADNYLNLLQNDVVPAFHNL